jgi:two-component system, cell cycle response regulator DivK
VGQKILVVEDNELNLKLFCDLLGAHGYAAEPVRDGREAVATARAFSPDLIVMDIQMPHISGLELIEQIKADADLRAIPIMAVTAYAAKGDEERIRDAGAEGYVSKPISVLRFVEAVRALLEAAGARVEAEAGEGAEPEGEGEMEVKEEGEATPPSHPGEMTGPPSPRPGDGAAPSWDPEGAAEETEGEESAGSDEGEPDSDPPSC